MGLGDPPDVPGAEALGSGGRRRGRDCPQDISQRHTLAQVCPRGPAGHRLRCARKLPEGA
eukprot:5778199-Alexandrium_andersonii.AAC.1